MRCNLCPRRCNAERDENSNINGFCKMPLLPKVARADLHFWEEPVISGENGSGTVFFSGCSMGCVYCQNYEISQENKGTIISCERLAEIFYELEKKGAHNINLVSPSHYIFAIKEALKIYRPKIPIVYNSSGYDNEESLKMLENDIDIFLLDLKYLSRDRAKLYSLAENYPENAVKAIKQAYRMKEKSIIENGIIKQGVIIRHLLLPQGTNEAMAVFDWVRENTPEAYFSIMSQYVPCGRAQEMPIINRKVTKREYEKVLNYIFDSGFQNVFIQERYSADKKYIPEFNGV